MKYINIMSVFFLISFSLFSLGDRSIIESEEGRFSLLKLTGGLDHPWALAILPDSEGILITERPGTLYLYKEQQLTEIKGLPPITAIGQGGLLDILLDPDFRSNRILYFSFSEAGSGGYGTAVAKAVLMGDQLNNLEIIFRAHPKSSGGNHFGSRLLSGNDGYLYITLGERGVMTNAQDLTHHGGSVIRINTNGGIPEENPYDAIYTYGHRNPQGMALNEKTGEIWIHEHGPKGGDEVNILKQGANYGWPLVTYGINYDGSIISDKTTAPGFEEPVLFWIPSIAPSGMTFYYGDRFPQWNGNVFVGALAGKHLRRLVLDGNTIIHQEVLLKNQIGRIRDVRTGPDGLIYVLTDEKNGALYQIAPESLEQ
jgi:aldose sugar dehydrogenase